MIGAGSPLYVIIPCSTSWLRSMSLLLINVSPYSAMSLRARWLSRRCSSAVSKPQAKQSPRNTLLSFRRQNSTDDFRHDQFSVAFKPARSHFLNRMDQGLVFFFSIEHGSPQFAV